LSARLEHYSVCIRLILLLINRSMANITKKVKKVSMSDLQKLVKKHGLTSSGSKKDIALRLWKLRAHVMTLTELKLVEDFLKLAPAKRYKALLAAKN